MRQEYPGVVEVLITHILLIAEANSVFTRTSGQIKAVIELTNP